MEGLGEDLRKYWYWNCLVDMKEYLGYCDMEIWRTAWWIWMCVWDTKVWRYGVSNKWKIWISVYGYINCDILLLWLIDKWFARRYMKNHGKLETSLYVEQWDRPYKEDWIGPRIMFLLQRILIGLYIIELDSIAVKNWRTGNNPI